MQPDKLTNANVAATAQTRLFSDDDRRNQITDDQWRDDWSLRRQLKLNEMIQSINAWQSGQTRVRAEWNTDSGLALTNTMGNEGANISIGGDPGDGLGDCSGHLQRYLHYWCSG